MGKWHLSHSKVQKGLFFMENALKLKVFRMEGLGFFGKLMDAN